MRQSRNAGDNHRVALLGHSTIVAIHRAAVESGLAEQRTALLAALDRWYVAGLALAPDPRSQLMSDLLAMNSEPAMLELWLKTARALTEGREESRFFERALHELEDRSSARAPPPLLPAPIGREPELAILRRAARTVEEGARSQIVLLRGEEGMGKEPLLSELARELEASPFVVFRARAEREQAAAFSTMRALVAHHLEAQQLDVSAIEAEVHDPICARFVGELLDLSVPETPELVAAHADRQLMVDHLRSALLDYFAAIRGARRLLIIVEEAQWIDPESLGVLEELCDHADEHPLLLCLAARPSLRLNAWSLLEREEVVELELTGLQLFDVKQLAGAIAGGEISDPLARALWERTGGNPLFVEQITSMLVAEGRIHAENAELGLPPTVEIVVRARLEALELAQREACARAALLDRPFFADEAAAIGIDRFEELAAPLLSLRLFAKRAKKSGNRGQEYRLTNSILAEVARTFLSPDDRRAAHLAIARFFANREGSDLERTAKHFDAGGDTASAAAHYVAATLHAARKGDSVTVIRCSEQVPAPAFDVLMARNDALQFTGRSSEQGETLRRALEVARSDAQRARARTEMVRMQHRAGRPLEAALTGATAIEEARASGDREALIYALGRCGSALIAAGRYDEAAALLSEAQSRSADAELHLRALVAGWGTQLAIARGDPAERYRACRIAVELYRQAGDVRRAAGARVNLADAHNRFGSYAGAEAELREALAECRRVGNKTMEGYALANLGYSLMMQNRADEARAALEGAIVLATAIGDARLAIIARLYRLRAEVLSGSREPRVWEALDALALEARERNLSWLEISSLALGARARLASGEAEPALERSQRALALLEEARTVEEDEAEVFLAHAKALAALGRRKESAAIVARARRRLLEVAEKMEDQILRAQFMHSVASHREVLLSSAP